MHMLLLQRELANLYRHVIPRPHDDVEGILPKSEVADTKAPAARKHKVSY